MKKLVILGLMVVVSMALSYRVFANSEACGLALGAIGGDSAERQVIEGLGYSPSIVGRIFRDPLMAEAVLPFLSNNRRSIAPPDGTIWYMSRGFEPAKMQRVEGRARRKPIRLFREVAGRSIADLGERIFQGGLALNGAIWATGDANWATTKAKDLVTDRSALAVAAVVEFQIPGELVYWREGLDNQTPFSEAFALESQIGNGPIFIDAIYLVYPVGKSPSELGGEAAFAWPGFTYHEAPFPMWR